MSTILNGSLSAITMLLGEFTFSTWASSACLMGIDILAASRRTMCLTRWLPDLKVVRWNYGVQNCVESQNLVLRSRSKAFWLELEQKKIGSDSSSRSRKYPKETWLPYSSFHFPETVFKWKAGEPVHDDTRVYPILNWNKCVCLKANFYLQIQKNMHRLLVNYVTLGGGGGIICSDLTPLKTILPCCDIGSYRGSIIYPNKKFKFHTFFKLSNYHKNTSVPFQLLCL